MSIDTALYRALTATLWPLALYWSRQQDPARWRERLGHYAIMFEQPPIWLHAASVGEAKAGGLLMNALRKQGVDAPFFVTTTTRTGAEAIRTFLQPGDRHAYAPIDTPSAVRRALDAIRPMALIVMEVEIWPHLWQRCEKQGVPIVLANARLSARSLLRYQRKLPTLWQQTLRRAAMILAQSEEIAERYRQLGVSAERIQIAGNLKYSLQIEAVTREQGLILKGLLGLRPVWLAASTHDSEEQVALAVHRELLKQFPDLLLVLVPRHPQRFDEVAGLCELGGLATQRRSVDASLPVAGDNQVYLADTLGELLGWYCAVDCCWVAGSFVDAGGHNPIEPALCGCPMVLGPDMGNFTELLAGLLGVYGCQQVHSEAALIESLTRLLLDPAAGQQQVQRAKRYCDQFSGAAERQADLTARVVSRLMPVTALLT